MKSRIEVNEDGDFILQIPSEVVAELLLDEGDLVLWDTDDDLVILEFP